MDMEHNYLGDIEISVCPNGQSVVLQSHMGWENFLGEPFDEPFDDPDNLTAGVCYEYGWSETSSLGQIEDPANATSVTYVGCHSDTDIVNPGIYESENTLRPRGCR